MRRNKEHRREAKLCKKIRKAEEKLKALNLKHQLLIRARIYAYLITKDGRCGK